MIKKVCICDICGRTTDIENGIAKIKIRDENLYNRDDWEWTKWEKYDLCKDCAENLMHLVHDMTRKGGK